jgi:hypothetical protein
MIIKGSLLTLASAVASAVLLALSPPPARAQSPESGFRVFIGCKTLKLGEHRFRHDTHPDDSFLPDSGVPGSAGVTDAGGTHYYVTLGGGYQARLSDLFSLNLDMGILLGVGNNRDRHQNANDDRPAESAAFVYSEAVFGWCASAGLSWHVGKFHAGVEAQLAGLFLESGWDRHGRDERCHRQTEHLITAGPRIGWTLTETILADGTVQFGRGATFGARIIWMF